MVETEDMGSQEGDGMMPPAPPPASAMPAGVPALPVSDVDGQPPLPTEPEVMDIKLHKVSGSMGLSIVAAKVRIILGE